MVETEFFGTLVWDSLIIYKSIVQDFHSAKGSKEFVLIFSPGSAGTELAYS